MNAPAAALNCPKCGRPRTAQAVECRGCGVIFAKVRPASPGPAARPGAVAAPSPGPAEPWAHVPSATMETFLTLLSQAVAAGLSITQFAAGPALGMLPSPLALRIQADLSAGLPLSAPLGALRALDPGCLAILRAGETRGGLPAALDAVVSRLEARRKNRRNLLVGLAYPAALLLAASFILPLPKLFGCGGARAYLGSALPPALALLGLAVFVLGIQPRLSPGSLPKRAARHLFVSFPGLSAISWHTSVATFAEVLGACLKAGLPMTESLRLSFEAADHPRFRDAYPAVAGAIEGGAQLSQALLLVPWLPQPFAAGVQAGEVAGKLDEVLPRLAEQHLARSRSMALLAIGIVIGLALAATALAVAISVIGGWTRIFAGQTLQLDQLGR